MSSKRPKIIRFATGFLWFYGVVVLAFQILFTWGRLRILDYPSITIGLFVLLAAVCLTGPAKLRWESNLLGSLALVWITIRSLLTVKVQYTMIDQFSHMPMTVAFGLILTALFALLTVQFIRAWLGFDSPPGATTPQGDELKTTNSE